MFWVGYPVDTGHHHSAEVELLNHGRTGHVHVTTARHRSTDTLTITGDRTPDGKFAKLLFTFPIVRGTGTPCEQEGDVADGVRDQDTGTDRTRHPAG
jgi:hypothetical protein